jgi:hypothetical protein
MEFVIGSMEIGLEDRIGGLEGVDRSGRAPEPSLKIANFLSENKNAAFTESGMFSTSRD